MAKRIVGIIVCVALLVTLVVVGNHLYLESKYPLKYAEIVEIYAEKYSVDRPLVFAVINTESNFNPGAVSKAGACGLMQIMPSTAAWIAREIGMQDYSSEKLYDPAVNIELGVFYLRYLLDKFGDSSTSAAAYNAGETNVIKWLALEEYSDNQKTLKHIPFEETRNYVVKVEKGIKVYESRIK